MKLRVDSESFVQKQEVLIRELLARIADVLEKYGLEAEALADATGELGFTISCMLDDTAGLEYEGIEANPYLTFLGTEDELIHSGGNSYSHELVSPLLNAMFDNGR